MLPDNLFKKELLEDFKSPRSLVFKFILPLLFLLPLAMEGVPTAVKASMVPLAVLFLGVFGSSIGLVQLREGNMLQRLAILPISPASILSGYLLANICMDLLQLTIPIAVVIMLGIQGPLIFTALICFVSAIVAANALGAIVATLAGSSGEVHLFAALTVLVVGGASGLFMPSVPAAMQQVASILPFASLSYAIQDLWAGTVTSIWFLAPISAFILFLVAVFLARVLFAGKGR